MVEVSCGGGEAGEALSVQDPFALHHETSCGTGEMSAYYLHAWVLVGLKAI